MNRRVVINPDNHDHTIIIEDEYIGSDGKQYCTVVGESYNNVCKCSECTKQSNEGNEHE